MSSSSYFSFSYRASVCFAYCFESTGSCEIFAPCCLAFQILQMEHSGIAPKLETQPFGNSSSQQFFSPGSVEQSLLPKSMWRLSYLILMVWIGSCTWGPRSIFFCRAHGFYMSIEMVEILWADSGCTQPAAAVNMLIYDNTIMKGDRPWLDKPCYSPRGYWPDLAP